MKQLTTHVRRRRQEGYMMADERLEMAADKTDDMPSAQAWFARGERVGYDATARAIIPAQGALLNVFLRREGNLAHTVSFLPGISGWLIWMGQGSALFTGCGANAKALCRIRRHGR
jgi:hypothetical protein